MGHIKRMCKEEVYCRYCKVYTHSSTACRTYPVTSSRKNTPEKRTSEDIEREIARRVQEEKKCILNNFSTSRRVANTQEASQPNQGSGIKEVTSQVHNIPKLGQHVQNLIGDYQRPPEVFERDTRSSNKTEGSGDQILNQQWDKSHTCSPHDTYNRLDIATSTVHCDKHDESSSRNSGERTAGQLDKSKTVGPSLCSKGKGTDFYDVSTNQISTERTTGESSK